jgi:hypothetical protein
LSTGWRTHWNSLWVASSLKLQNLTWIWPMLIRKSTINFWICAVELRCYMHIKIWYLKYFKVLCITQDGGRTKLLIKEVRSLKYTQNKCASNYIFLKRFGVPLVLMAMIYILFQICVLIEVVKLFHYKHLKLISPYWFHSNFRLCYPTTWSLKSCTTHFVLSMERLTLLKVTSWMLWRNCFGLRHHRSAEGGTISIPTGRHVDNDIIPSLKINTDF